MKTLNQVVALPYIKTTGCLTLKNVNEVHRFSIKLAYVRHITFQLNWSGRFATFPTCVGTHYNKLVGAARIELATFPTFVGTRYNKLVGAARIELATF